MLEHGWGMGVFGLIFWVVVLAAIAGVVWFFCSLPTARGRNPRPTGRELLEERIARGEIGREEYLQKRRGLED